MKYLLKIYIKILEIQKIKLLDTYEFAVLNKNKIMKINSKINYIQNILDKLENKLRR